MAPREQVGLAALWIFLSFRGNIKLSCVLSSDIYEKLALLARFRAVQVVETLYCFLVSDSLPFYDLISQGGMVMINSSQMVASKVPELTYTAGIQVFGTSPILVSVSIVLFLIFVQMSDVAMLQSSAITLFLGSFQKVWQADFC